MKMIVLLVFLTGCAHLGQYKADCLTGISSEGELNQKRLDHNIGLAKSLLVPTVLPDEATFCAVYGDMPIHVRRDAGWECSGDDCTVGGYDFFAGIELSTTTESLVHEMLHAWDAKHFAVGTANHQGWDTNGYFELSNKYKSGFMDPTVAK